MWLMAPIVAVLAWPLTPLAVEPGLDPSWQVAMSLARLRGLDFGTDVAFTYGPLGFLIVPSIVTWSSAVANLVYTLLVQFAVAATALWGLRRVAGWAGATVVAYLLCVIAGVVGTEVVIPLVLVWSVAVVRGVVPDRLQVGVLAALGAVAGMHLLVKFSVGLIAGGLAALTAVAARSRADVRQRVRLAGVVFLSSMCALLLGWITTGNAITALPRHLLQSLAIASGYSAAMGLEDPTRPGEYAFALLAVAAVAAALGASIPHRRVITGLLTAFALFGLFKAGFVRHDSHSTIFFGGAALAMVAFPARPGREVTQVLSVGVAAMLLFVTLGTLPVTLARPWKSVPALAHRVAVVATPGRAAQTIEASRARLREAYQLDATTLALLQGHTVHVHPWEASVIWAYDLPWKPVPIFQSYSAYTPSLDERNAEVLASPDGPERILVEGRLAIDGRQPEWEQPRTTVAMACHYEERYATERWQVLSKVPDRCGEERELATVDTDGEAVPVPDGTLPDGSSIVVARVHAPGPGLLSRLLEILFKPPPSVADVPGDHNPRVIERNIEGPLLVRPSGALGYSGPFQQADVDALGFDLDSDGQGDDVRIEFSEIPIEG